MGGREAGGRVEGDGVESMGAAGGCTDGLRDGPGGKGTAVGITPWTCKAAGDGQSSGYLMGGHTYYAVYSGRSTSRMADLEGRA